MPGEIELEPGVSDPPRIAPSSLRFEPASPQWFEAWRVQYGRYAVAVHSPVDDETAAKVWSWLLARAHGLEGILAVDGEQLAGFAHIRPFPRTLDGDQAGFLDDLWVAETHRGSGLADALLARVCSLGRERG
ncbi:MAG: hypothetical protein NVS4B13_06340 [Candidatus Elarobacter sp.]